MSWDAVNTHYLAQPIQGQIRDLSFGMNAWATNFEGSLDDRAQGAFTVSIRFAEKPEQKKVTTETVVHKYTVVNDGGTGDDFTPLIKKIKEFALGKQHSFGVFVRMEDVEPADWSLSIQESFLGCVVQERDAYKRKDMMESLGLT